MHLARIGVALALAGLTVLGAVQPADAKPWRKLHRPLDLPQLATEDACPVSAVDQRVDWERHSFFGSPGIGPGPVYPGLGFSGGHLATTGTRFFDGRPWFGDKVMWYVKPTYRKRVLIRGRRLDGPGKVRFHGGSAWRARDGREGRIKRKTTVSWRGKPRRSRGVPSFVFVRTPGCYGVQIDGTRFSRVVVFTASTP